MKKRRPLPMSKDRKVFKRNAVKTHKKNTRPTHLMRGGFRL